MTNIAYQYDLDGILLGETVADESPLEPGVFHLPAYSTLIEPPAEIPSDKVARFNGSGWDIISKPPAPVVDPVAKLQAFLLANPDVAEVLKQGSI